MSGCRYLEQENDDGGVLVLLVPSEAFRDDPL